jgi:hypothetical protein
MEIARERPADTITLEELAASAGVEVTEVHKLGLSVVDVTEAALSDLIGYLEEDLALIATHDTNEFALVAESHRMILEHLIDYAPIYLSSNTDRLWRVITKRFFFYLSQRIEFHPERLPFQEASERDKKMLATYTAAGTVAAMEVWLRSGDTRDLDDAVTVIFAAAPAWIFDSSR